MHMLRPDLTSSKAAVGLSKPKHALAHANSKHAGTSSKKAISNQHLQQHQQLESEKENLMLPAKSKHPFGLVAPNAIGSGLEPCARKSLLGSNKKQHQVRVSPQPLKNFRSPRPNAADLPPFLEAKIGNTLNNNIAGAGDTGDGTLLKTAEFPNKQYAVISPPRRRFSD